MFYIIGMEKKNVLEVTENKVVVFNCSVDGNPESDITLSFRGKELTHEVSARNLIYLYRVTSCFDEGVYKCATQNIYNNEPSIKGLKLLVNCKSWLLLLFLLVQYTTRLFTHVLHLILGEIMSGFRFVVFF